MTGKHKNEEFDIISQAQKVVEEYEERYFKCLSETFIKKRRNKARRNIFVLLTLFVGLVFAIVLKIFFI